MLRWCPSISVPHKVGLEFNKGFKYRTLSKIHLPEWRTRQNCTILYPKRPKVFGESQPLFPPLFVLFPRWRWTYKREGRGLEGAHTMEKRRSLVWRPPTIQPSEPGAPDRLCLISKPSPPSPPPISPLLQPTQRDTFDMTRDTVHNKEDTKGVSQGNRSKLKNQKSFLSWKEVYVPVGFDPFHQKEGGRDLQTPSPLSPQTFMKREEDELTFSIPSPPFLFLAAKKEERTLTPQLLLPPREDPAVSGDSNGSSCVLIPRQDKGLVYSMKVLLSLNLSLSPLLPPLLLLCSSRVLQDRMVNLQLKLLLWLIPL